MIDAYHVQLIEKHHATGVVVDTNLLLVYFIGLCNRALIEGFKRTQKYTLADFDLLARLLARFVRIVTTPTILTEVNSLANQLRQDQKPSFYALFKRQITILDERHQPSRRICEHVYFPKCGLSDAAILTIAEEGLLVLTDDFKLDGYLQARNIDRINFTHLRASR